MLSAPAARTPSRDLRLAACLSLIAGFANAAALRSAGVFSANVTGNVSLAADRMASGAWSQVALFVGVATSFALGAFSCTRIDARARRSGITNPARLCLSVEAAAMAALAAACLCLDGMRAPLVLCHGLAFLMGCQNALASNLTSSRVRATHLSGIFTDLGIEVSTWMDMRRDGHERSGLHDAMTLRVATIASFLAGGVAGALAWSHLGPAELLAPAAALGFVAWIGACDTRDRDALPGNTLQGHDGRELD